MQYRRKHPRLLPPAHPWGSVQIDTNGRWPPVLPVPPGKEVKTGATDKRRGEGGRESWRERKKEDTLVLGEMSGRFRYILVDNKEFKMENEASG